MGGLSADAGVDLVEDHCLAASHGRDRECDARELAAGGGLCHRGERQTWVRPDQERNLVGPGLAGISLTQLGHELAFTQTDAGQLTRDLLRKA